MPITFNYAVIFMLIWLLLLHGIVINLRDQFHDNSSEQKVFF